ncbi:ATP-binding cassette domain-containing protein [Dysgonomonas sp. 216]|uniref:cell division ATP-binding protein FtsE n=1 Tax=Dysgonomonas sp. 216 TaxID=2302934 RepID=UPI0013D7905B|nr:ATP-binding cassette domain-containing protein [Dysgonomonas sp. 216]NDW18084.1 ATP-binding cassette domain-containing protein [Dysgonomonas sp. 216]
MDIIVEYKDVTLSRDRNVILQHVNLQINEGDFVYLIGKVGAGKSTLLKSLYAEMPLDEGRGFVMDYELHSLKAKDVPFLRRKIGIVFQDFQLLIDRSVDKNLEFVLRATGWNSKDLMKERIREVLAQVGMQNKGYKMPHELSGGEQQRVVIARALLNSPELILADEPTGNLDPETSNQIVQLLQDISKAGTAVVMSTHNYAIVQKFQGRILKCEDGVVKEMRIATSI